MHAQNILLIIGAILLTYISFQGIIKFTGFGTGNEATNYNQLIAQIEQNNSHLSTFSEKMLDETIARVKKKPTYKALLKPMQTIQEQTDDFKDFLIEEENKLIQLQQHRFFSFKNDSKEIFEKVNKETESVLEKFIVTIYKVSENRNLGIKPDEIRSLKEKVKLNFRPFTLNQIGRVSSETIQSMMIQKRNSADLARNQIIGYLKSKIGSTTLCCFPFHTIVSLAENVVVELGETFTSRIFYSYEFQNLTCRNRLGPMVATVDGIPLEGDGPMFFYETKPVVSGEYKYTVRMGIKNRFTGKTDNFKRTFSYYVK